MSEKKSFMEWLYDQSDKDDPVGDLASDTRTAGAPSHGDIDILIRTMANYYPVCDGAIAAVKIAKRRYKAYCKRQGAKP